MNKFKFIMTSDKHGPKFWWLNRKNDIKEGSNLKNVTRKKFYYNKNGRLHREDGPAFISADGDKYWYIHGRLHRENGPAIERDDGHKEWYLNGKKYTEEEFNIKMNNKLTVTTDKHGSKFWWLNNKLHRETGPAVEHANGHKSWYINGELHREDGPALEWPDGTKSWYINGRLHREDGPAIEDPRRSKIWYLNGVNLTEEEFNIKMNNKPTVKDDDLTVILDFITHSDLDDTKKIEFIKKLLK